jgi:hypothetical protein
MSEATVEKLILAIRDVSLPDEERAVAREALEQLATGGNRAAKEAWAELMVGKAGSGSPSPTSAEPRSNSGRDRLKELEQKAREGDARRSAELAEKYGAEFLSEVDRIIDGSHGNYSPELEKSLACNDILAVFGSGYATEKFPSPAVRNDLLDRLRAVPDSAGLDVFKVCIKKFVADQQGATQS